MEPSQTGTGICSDATGNSSKPSHTGNGICYNATGDISCTNALGNAHQHEVSVGWGLWGGTFGGEVGGHANLKSLDRVC